MSDKLAIKAFSRRSLASLPRSEYRSSLNLKSYLERMLLLLPEEGKAGKGVLCKDQVPLGGGRGVGSMPSWWHQTAYHPPFVIEGTSSQ